MVLSAPWTADCKDVCKVLQNLIDCWHVGPGAQATELRLAGNAEARGGDLQRAIELYTQVPHLFNQAVASCGIQKSMSGVRMLSRQQAILLTDNKRLSAPSQTLIHVSLPGD